MREREGFTPPRLLAVEAFPRLLTCATSTTIESNTLFIGSLAVVVMGSDTEMAAGVMVEVVDMVAASVVVSTSISVVQLTLRPTILLWSKMAVEGMELVEVEIEVPVAIITTMVVYKACLFLRV